MAEKNEKLMPRGLIPSSPEVLAAAKKYTVPERKGLPEVFLRWISCVRTVRRGICRHFGRLPDAGRFRDRIKNKDDRTAVAHLP